MKYTVKQGPYDFFFSRVVSPAGRPNSSSRLGPKFSQSSRIPSSIPISATNRLSSSGKSFSRNSSTLAPREWAKATMSTSLVERDTSLLTIRAAPPQTTISTGATSPYTILLFKRLRALSIARACSKFSVSAIISVHLSVITSNLGNLSTRKIQCSSFIHQVRFVPESSFPFLGVPPAPHHGTIQRVARIFVLHPAPSAGPAKTLFTGSPFPPSPAVLGS